MAGHGYCAHCRTAAQVASGLAGRMKEAVEAHAGSQGCPARGLRHPDPFAPGSPERVAVESAVEARLP